MAGGESQRSSREDPDAAGEQRQRLVAAISKAASEHGYAKLTVDQVLRYAGVSQAIFDAHFESKEQGLIAAQDAFLDRLWLDVVSACDSPAGWPLKVRAALAAILASLVEASNLARVFAVEAAAASLAAAERQFAVLDQFATLLQGGRRLYPNAASLPDATERALVGATTSLIGSRLICGQVSRLAEIEPQLVQLVLIPYMGVEEARHLAEAAP